MRLDAGSRFFGFLKQTLVTPCSEGALDSPCAFGRGQRVNVACLSPARCSLDGVCASLFKRSDNEIVSISRVRRSAKYPLAALLPGQSQSASEAGPRAL